MGANSDAGWVALTSQPAPDSQIFYSAYPAKAADPINWNEGFKDMVISIPIEARLGVLIFGEAATTAIAVALVVEGGVYLIHHGSAYVQETVSHLVAIPQGALAGLNTEYTVNVDINGTTVVQVISGPVIYMDPITNNTINIQTDQQLTLPPAQQNGFSQQDLQSDVSGFNPASMNQWWTQATNTSSLGVLGQPTIFGSPCGSNSSSRNYGSGCRCEAQKENSKPVASTSASYPIYKRSAKASAKTVITPSEHPFCPDCGKQLPQAKRFCPYCGFDRQLQQPNGQP